MRFRRALALAMLLTISAAACREGELPVARGRGDIVIAADSEIVAGQVKSGASFSDLLAGHDVHAADVQGIIEAAGRVFDLRRVRAAQPYRVERTLAGCVRLVEYEIDTDRYLHVTPRSGESHAFDASVELYETAITPTVVRGSIDDDTPSLFAAMSEAGERPDLSIALADIFAGEVDFNTDLQPGDRFDLLVDKVERDDRLVRYGEVAAATLLNDGRALVAVRFTPAGGKPGYYDADGRSLKRFFLRSPLRFDPQVTSRFSRARLHPVLNLVRAHFGVDYRAPVGAPVIAVAHGVVTGAGWRGGGGRTVTVRHASGYESSYLHLSSIAPGIRPGARVSQGQVIGKVGASGLATGPHLDYRLKKHGTWVNPLAEHRRLPPGEPIRSDDRPAFESARDAALGRLRTPPSVD